MKKRIVKIVFAIVFIVILPLSVYARVVCLPDNCDWQPTSNLFVSAEYKNADQHKVTEREREKCSICGDIRIIREIFAFENHTMVEVKNPPEYKPYNNNKHYKITRHYNKCKYCSRGEKLDDIKVLENHTLVTKTRRDDNDPTHTKLITFKECSKCGKIVK